MRWKREREREEAGGRKREERQRWKGTERRDENGDVFTNGLFSIVYGGSCDGHPSQWLMFSIKYGLLFFDLRKKRTGKNCVIAVFS